MPVIRTLTPPMKNGLFTSFLLLASFTLAGQNALGYKLESGNSFTIRQHALQDITQEMESGTQVITNDIKSIMEFTITGMEDSLYLMDVEFKDLKMLMRSDLYGELMNVDTSIPKENDLQSKIFQSLIGQKVSIKMTPRGKIYEVNGGDKLIENMVNAAGFEDDFTRDMLSASLSKDFGSEALSKSYEQMTFFYPSQEVAIGDTWNTKFEGKLATQNTWTLSAMTEERSEIKGTAEAVLSIKDDQTSMELSGNQNSMILIDPLTGLFRTLEVKGEYRGYSIIKQLGDQEIPTKIVMSLNYQLIQ
ncbi:MAG: DUF6263 family protein [Flavobacteriaceae bacterium]|nr:DUF6263 family protein [Flavobacteriaceae bacterium]